jgi:mRNA-degrading endonuclease toxin of MazEF toxin-antitoxin module
MPGGSFAERGEIWFAHLPTDPPGKGPRPVIVVSLDSRNRHERADTVLVIPLTTTIHKESVAAIFLPAGETGLPADSVARADNVTVVPKTALLEPRVPLRRVSNSRICELARKVAVAMGCPIE